MTQLITREFSSKLDNGVSLEGIAFASTSLYDTRFDLSDVNLIDDLQI